MRLITVGLDDYETHAQVNAPGTWRFTVRAYAHVPDGGANPAG